MFFDIISNTFSNFLQSLPKTLDAKFDERKKKNELEANLQGLDELVEQKSSYNEYIPLVFGNAQLAGNVIWAGMLQAYVEKDGGASIHNTLYDSAVQAFYGSNANKIPSDIYRTTTAEFATVYKLDFAIAICEGEVDEIFSIQVGGNELDMSKYKHRIYLGSQTQEPDPLIESIKGVGKTPAFRGLCYIVFEEFPISDFNNAIPNFIFSVRRNVSKKSEGSVNQLVKGITLIPGTGEFAYHTDVITKYIVKGTRKGDIIMPETAQTMNSHNNTQKANVVLALDNLQKSFPQLEWVSVVVCWFGDSLDTPTCNIYPACEFNEYNMVTTPHEWSVAGQERHSAKVISKDANGNARYGGTPSDTSVMALLHELKTRGYKINLLPMLMMDIEGKPWRGRLTGDASTISNFFKKTNGFNAFIKHYASLGKDYINSFAIGSEMIGLTKINDGNNNFPAVDELCTLAGEVREIVGNDVKLTYAADWSEYHHTDGGFYNMDKLWANSNIDFIGIDAYFPLTETTVKPTITEIKERWQSGEGWDFVYNQTRTAKENIAPEWAWKNIRWFVENSHINADGTQTLWQPNMKKVWLVEYGFPSVDLCTNQPNVFYDPASTENALPHSSNGYVDYESQTNAIIATEQFWAENSDIVENKFLWTWDARPYPFFPRLESVWSDCNNWQYGHWVNGKAMNSYIKDVVSLLFNKAGIPNFQASQLAGIVHGMVIKGSRDIHNLLQSLTILYNFRIFEKNGQVAVQDIKSFEEILLNENSIMVDEEKTEILDFSNIGNISYKRLILYFYDIDKDHTVNHIYFEDFSKTDGREYSMSVPFVLTANQAEEIARKSLKIINSIKFQEISLPATEESKNIHGGMLIRISSRNFIGIVESIKEASNVITLNLISISQAILEEFLEVKTTEVPVPNINQIAQQPNPIVEIIDTNNFSNKAQLEGTFPLYFSFQNVPKQGLSFYYSTDGIKFSKAFEVYGNSTVGKVISYNQTQIQPHTVDTINKMEVLLFNGKTLSSITDSELLTNKNLCIIGNELCNFKNAKQKIDVEQSNVTFEISHFLRGRFDSTVETDIEGKRFILIDGNTRKFDFSLTTTELYFKNVPHGSLIEECETLKFTPSKNGIKNWKVNAVHQTALQNGDIKISWHEQQSVIQSTFTPAKTHLKHFVVNIGSRSINVTGVNFLTYTTQMQAEDNFQGNLSVEVYEI